MDKSTYFFLHIPKAAGSTLKYSLNYIYDKDEVFNIANNVKNASIKYGFNKLSKEKQSKIKLVAGHGYYGMHEGLKVNHKVSYFTFLRDPVKRLISLYNQNLNSNYEDNLIKQYIVDNNASLKDLILSQKFRGFHNDQCRLISGLPFDLNQTDQELFERAKCNIEKSFNFIGIQEYFLISLLMLKEKLGWEKYPFHLNLNQSRGKKIIVSSFPKSIYKIIEEKNQADIKLYNYYLNKFLEEYNLDKKIWDSKLIAFNKKNNHYSKLNYPIYTVKKNTLLFLSQLKRKVLK